MLYERIKKLCNENKLSITKLEQEAGLSRGSICKWSVSSPTANSIKSVANILGVTVDELLKEPE